MIVKRVRVRNFRSFVDSTIELENLTALVGANGAGKSSVLCALEVFYGQITSLTQDDFFNKETDREIAITVTFAELPTDAQESLQEYTADGELVVERVIRFEAGKISSGLHGIRLQESGFNAIRAAGNATERKPLYAKLRLDPSGKYASLPAWQNQQDALTALRIWEAANQGACARQRDDGGFFNFKRGGAGDLNRHTRLLFIPAVKDVASDAVEGRGAVITTLLDMLVRGELAKRPEIAEIQTETLARYKALLTPEKLVEFRKLSENLNRTLRLYAPTTSVRLEWQPIAEIEMPVPTAHIRVIEDEFETTAERTGHGVQRAFILALLQRLAELRSDSPTQPPRGDGPAQQDQASLLLAIEEPELYQHPSRQRHLAGVLMKLATAGVAGVVRKTQVVYTTHSPLFVGIDRFNQVRICRKVRPLPAGPKQTLVAASTLQRIAEALWVANGSQGEPYTAESLLPRLHAVMTPMVGEGFFANVVVLVEGEDDQAAIIGAARALGHDFHGLGISVIPCRGKSSLDRPAAIFRDLGIPTYVVWDGDKGKAKARPQENKLLLRLLDKPPEDWPSQQSETFTVFEQNLETTLRAELGAADYDEWVAEALSETDLSPEQGLKNPAVFERVLRSAAEAGKGSPTLNAIVKAVVTLKT